MLVVAANWGFTDGTLVRRPAAARAARARERPTVPSGLSLAVRFRAATRPLQTVFGDVTVRRMCWRDRNHITIRPADAELNRRPSATR